MSTDCVQHHRLEAGLDLIVDLGVLLGGVQTDALPFAMTDPKFMRLWNNDEFRAFVLNVYNKIGTEINKGLMPDCVLTQQTVLVHVWEIGPCTLAAVTVAFHDAYQDMIASDAPDYQI
jgi:hypothetical protein